MLEYQGRVESSRLTRAKRRAMPYSYHVLVALKEMGIHDGQEMTAWTIIEALRDSAERRGLTPVDCAREIMTTGRVRLYEAGTCGDCCTYNGVEELCERCEDKQQEATPC